MEQYWTPKELDFYHLRLCLDDFPHHDLFIRLIGSMGGTAKVKESLEGRTLDFSKADDGLRFLIDAHEVFHFPLKDYHKGFSVAYERIFPDGRIYIPSTGIDPYDPELPEPSLSTLRAVWDDHLVEIGFKGRIPLEFHSYIFPPETFWKYWRIPLAHEK